MFPCGWLQVSGVFPAGVGLIESDPTLERFLLTIKKMKLLIFYFIEAWVDESKLEGLHFPRVPLKYYVSLLE